VACHNRPSYLPAFPASLIGTTLLETNAEWQMQHRYMGIKATS
jgi:hypothetical protein